MGFIQKKYIQVFLFLGLIFGGIQQVAAQKKVKTAPDWIAMMDDPNVNYFKAIDAFNRYWKGKVEPIEEDELFETGGEEEKEHELRERKKARKNDPAKIYAFEYKKFKNWMENIKPFVQSDGHILSMDERVADWKIQEAAKAEQQRAFEKVEKDRLERWQKDKGKKEIPVGNRGQEKQN